MTCWVRIHCLLPFPDLSDACEQMWLPPDIELFALKEESNSLLVNYVTPRQSACSVKFKSPLSSSPPVPDSESAQWLSDQSRFP